jgi:hypothetical protein
LERDQVSDYQHVVYLTSNGHVHELYYPLGATGPQWATTDLIADTGAPAAVAGSALTSWAGASISLVVGREDFTFTGSGWIPGTTVQVESDYPVSGSGTESIQNSYTYVVDAEGTFGDTISASSYLTPGEHLVIAVTDAASGQSAEAEGITPD